MLFKERFGKHSTIFIFISDEPDWIVQYFGNDPFVYQTTNIFPWFKNRNVLDLAIAAGCNHSIMRLV